MALVRWIVWAVVLGVFLAGMAFAESEGSKTVGATTDTKRKQLAEYLVALDKAHKGKDSELVSVLNYKIKELLDEIVTPYTTNTTDSVPNPSPTLVDTSSVKSESSEYATKKCDELRNMLVQLLRKTNPLKRRERSTFSELSDSEKKELQEATREMNIVSEIMKARCAAEPSPKQRKKAKRNN